MLINHNAVPNWNGKANFINECFNHFSLFCPQSSSLLSIFLSNQQQPGLFFVVTLESIFRIQKEV